MLHFYQLSILSRTLKFCLLFSLVVSLVLSCSKVVIEEAPANPNYTGFLNDKAGEMNSEMNQPDMQVNEIIDAFVPRDCQPLNACGSLCVDLQTDSLNCGECGLNCAAYHAVTSCEAGRCVLLSCEENYIDVDGLAENGCEIFSDCEPNQACQTSCNTEGLSRCNDSGEMSCQPPEERCNLKDDDCDDDCDEDWDELGCRQLLYRGHSSNRGGHSYARSEQALSNQGFDVEASRFWFYADSMPNGEAVYLCAVSNGRTFLSTQNDCGTGSTPLEKIGYWVTRDRCGSTELYHLYHPGLNNHLYTVEASERDRVIQYGYQSMGVVGYVWDPYR